MCEAQRRFQENRERKLSESNLNTGEPAPTAQREGQETTQPVQDRNDQKELGGTKPQTSSRKKKDVQHMVGHLQHQSVGEFGKAALQRVAESLEGVVELTRPVLGPGNKHFILK